MIFTPAGSVGYLTMGKEFRKQKEDWNNSAQVLVYQSVLNLLVDRKFY